MKILESASVNDSHFDLYRNLLEDSDKEDSKVTINMKPEKVKLSPIV
jgi:hypothetical protein